MEVARVSAKGVDFGESLARKGGIETQLTNIILIPLLSGGHDPIGVPDGGGLAALSLDVRELCLPGDVGRVGETFQDGLRQPVLVIVPTKRADELHVAVDV